MGPGNDTFVAAGVYNGKTYYVGQSDGWFLYWGPSSSSWAMSPVLGTDETLASYVSLPGEASLMGQWYANVAPDPGGTIA